MMIMAYATADAATDLNKSTKEDNVINNLSVNPNLGKGEASAWLHSDINASQIQVRIVARGGIADGYRDTRVEVDAGSGWQTWNKSEHNSRQKHDIFGILTGPKPLNISKKVDVTAILDAIGRQEAQFDDVQGVTLYGLDDARVMDYYGYGDCWADSCWLYDKLTAAGIPVRIMGYKDGGWGAGWRHTWIEINIGNGWETWNYTKYNSKHAGDNGYGTPFVLVEPGKAPADILSTGY